MSDAPGSRAPSPGGAGVNDPPRTGLSEPTADRPSHRRSLLEATLQGLPFGVAVYDGEGRCILANAAALQFGPACPAELPAAPQDGDNAAFLREDGGRVIETRMRALRSEQEAYALATFADVTQRHRTEQDLLRRAYIDSLTGLPNRMLIEQYVADLIGTIAPGATFALAFIDLDNFKHINDYYSHAAGDALLTKVADRIMGALRPADMLARVGGDEFVLLITPTADAAATQAFVAGIAERLKAPFYIEGHEIFASASIGLSMYPEQGSSYDVLRRKADSAMYRVKAGVKGGVTTFDDSMDQATTERMAIEQRLRLAIRDRRFCCAFQPKVEMRTGQVKGVEVLLRWQDDQGAIRAPGDFIELAVELGLINDITFQVLDQTVRSLGDIDALFGADATISINIAAKQAGDIEFMSSFADALAKLGCARRFMIELTEEAFFTKSRFQDEVLPRIRAAGARVSIDDFGVGYSSLAALAEITADELKIDRTFITDIHKRPRSQVVLKAIESLGQALGMSLVAEGVETYEEVAYLQAATQIRTAQGFYFAKPMLLGQLTDAWKPSPARDPASHRSPPLLRRRGLAR